MNSGPKSDKNYMTPQGVQVLREEYHHLHSIERPKVVETVAWAASNGDRSENADYLYGKKRLREIDKRLRFLAQRLEKVEVIDPEKIVSNLVVFGALITIENEDGDRFVYQIVGEDETHVEKGKISWKSPLARAFLGKKVDDEVTVQKPTGTQVFTLIKLEFTKAS